MVITAVLVAFAMTVGVYADMMPISPSPAVSYPLAPLGNQAHSEPVSRHDAIARQVAFDLGFLSVASLAGGPINTEPTGPAQPSVQILTTDRSSFDLCLYTLLGLGLCRSGHWVRRSGLGVVPEWYHTGGPYQIGHSHALEPNTLCPVPTCCFIQPNSTAADSLSARRTGVLAPRRHPSEQTPNNLPSRAPPAS